MRLIKGFFVANKDKASFTAGDVLLIVQAVASEFAERPEPLTLVGTPERLSAIFYDWNIIVVRKLANALHVCGMSIEMDRHDRLCLVTDRVR